MKQCQQLCAEKGVVINGEKSNETPNEAKKNENINKNLSS